MKLVKYRASVALIGSSFMLGVYAQETAGPAGGPTPEAPPTTASTPAPVVEAPAETPSTAAPATVAPTPAPVPTEAVKSISASEWQEEYRQLNELVKRYEDDVSVFRKDVQSFIDQKYRDETLRIQQTYDTMYKKLDDEMRVRREQAIAAFERFIQKYPMSEHTPLAIFRLAELYYDQSMDAFVVAQLNYEQLLKGLDLSDTKSLPEDPKYDFSRSLALYERIVKDFPSFKHIDGVLYMRGYLLGNDRAAQYDAEGSRDAWLELINGHQGSQYASQAYLRVGDYYFEKSSDQDLRTAIEYYQRVMSFRDKWFDRALYKEAWSYYKLSDYPHALARFIDLIDYSERRFQETGEESDLRVEAVEYVAISFAESGTVKDALALFDKIGDRRYKLEVLKKLAETYRKQAKFPESIETYITLQKLFPYNEDNPKFQDAIVEIQGNIPGESEAVLVAMEDLIKKYSTDSEWWSQQGINRQAMTKAQELLEKRLRELAFHYHEQALQSKVESERQRYFVVAAEKYDEYLKRFPYATRAYEMQYWFAECLFFSQRFEESAREFEKAMTSTNPQYHADAAGGVVNSYEELISRKEGAEGVKKPFAALEKAEKPDEKDKDDKAAKLPHEPVAPVALSDMKRKFVDAIDVLARVASSNPDVPKYQFLAAQIFFFHRQYVESGRRYQEFIDQYPADNLSVVAAANLVDGLRAQERWLPCMEAIDRLTKLSLGADPKEWSRKRDELIELRVKAQDQHARVLAKEQRFEDAVKEFEKAGTAVGWLNAARLLEQMGKVDRSIEDYQQLIRQHPKSEYVEEALFRIASNFEKFFELPKAIENYERLATEFPKSQHAVTAMYNAAYLRIGLHQYKEAARAYERYSLTNQSQPDAEIVQLYAADNYIKAGDVGEAVRAYKDYLRRYGRAHGDRTMKAHLAIIEGLEKLGRKQEAVEVERKTPALYASLKDMPTLTSEGAHFYALIMFREMSRMLTQFQEVKLTGNQQALAAGLGKKISLLTELDKKKSEMIKIGDVDGATAALYSLGVAYHSLADALREAVPKDISGQDLEDYMAILEEQYVIPFEERALSFYRSNFDIETNQRYWNNWIDLTHQKAYELRPNLFPLRKKEVTQSIPLEQEQLSPPLTLPVPSVSLRLSVQSEETRAAPLTRDDAN